jgi:hypothetical protein
MKGHGLNPVPTLREMRRLLQLQEDEAGSLLAYLDKFHYPLWITQFYENIDRVTLEIVEAAHSHGVRLLECGIPLAAPYATPAGHPIGAGG